MTASSELVVFLEKCATGSEDINVQSGFFYFCLEKKPDWVRAKTGQREMIIPGSRLASSRISLTGRNGQRPVNGHRSFGHQAKKES